MPVYDFVHHRRSEQTELVTPRSLVIFEGIMIFVDPRVRELLLATADDESVRDSAAAVESAKLACELSNYESVSDLSALAASLAADPALQADAALVPRVAEALSPEMDGGLILTIGCCLYLGTGMVLGIPFHIIQRHHV